MDFLQRANRKIEIVGAGPSGLVAGINLARAGYKVTVCEDKPDVGHRFHGDFQGLENWSSDEDVTVLLERLGLRINYICQPYKELIVFDSELRKAIYQSERPFFYLVQRGGWFGCLDYGLMEQAMESGVEIIFSKGNAMEMFKNHYNPSFVKRVLYPLASFTYKSRLIDKGCHGANCACVWCRCGKEEVVC